MLWVLIFFAAVVTLVVMAVRGAWRKYWRGEQPAPQTSTRSSRSADHESIDETAANIAAKVKAVVTKPPVAIAGLVLLMLVSFWQTSVVNPGGTQIAQFERIYLCTSIKDGRNVALPGECGRQSYIRMPGFGIEWFVGVLNKVTYVEMVEVPDWHYATLTARDGLKLDDGQVAAKPWPTGVSAYTSADGKQVSGDMLDASFFLQEGKGHKGPQTTILTPGRWAVNTYLWDVSVDEKDKNGRYEQTYVRTTIPAGHVGVIRSAIDETTAPAFAPHAGAPVNCSAASTIEKDLGQIKAVLVPVGCRGVWKEPLPPGEYFVNRLVYQVVDVDTRVNNWTYQGGYTRRYIDLTVDDSGKITQKESEEKIGTSKDAAGEAIAVKVEGWTVFQELRLQARVKPEDAPLVVAAVGGLKEIEDRIITPQVRSVLRNIGGSRITVKNATAYDEAKSDLDALKARHAVLKDAGIDVGLSNEQRASELAQLDRQIATFRLPDPNIEVTRPTRVLDFQNERAALEKLVANDIQQIGKETGIEIVGVTLGNADIPPELLVSRKIEQLSGQLRNAYTQMRTAQVQRQTTEAAKARADKQQDLVTAAIGVETSKLKIEQRTNEGLAEQRYAEAFAVGQKAQTDVLGADKVAGLQGFKMVIDAVQARPEIITGIRLPNTVVFGQGGLEGPAAILRGAMGGDAPANAASTTASRR